MGMKYMTAFLKEKNMLKPHELRDSKLVIDGYALLYYAVEQTEEAQQSGNEQVCEEFYDYLKQMLYDLVECQIQCYVIFDGGLNNTTKQKKFYQFKKQLAKLDTAMTENKDITRFINSYFLNAMIHILNELEIPHATCFLEEADEIISALAKHLECPILSNDSNFFFSPASLVPIWSCTRERGADFVSCKIFSREEFLQVFRLNEEVLPIILTVLQKHYFEPQSFEMFFSNCGISTHEFDRISGLLEWLSTQTFKTAAEVVKKYHKFSRNLRFPAVFEVLLSMRNITTGSQTENYIFKYMTNPSSATVKENDPDWFVKGILSGRINESYINMYKRSTYLCHPDKMFLPSLRILRYAFDLFNNFSPSTWFDYQGQGQTDRKSLRITKQFSIKAPQLRADRRPLFGSGWERLPDYFGHFVRETLPGLPESALCEVPADCRLWLLALVWWKAHVGAYLQTHHCMMLCRIRGALLAPERAARLGINNREQAMEALKRLKYKGVNSLSEEQKEHVAGGCLHRLQTELTLNRCVGFLHVLDQLNCLNTLCAGPYQEVRLYEAYNYNFLYSITQLGTTLSGEIPLTPESVFEAGEVRDLYKKLLEAFDRCMEAVAHTTPDLGL